MQIGIGLPGTHPGIQAPVLLDWARRADSGPFSSLGSLDRLVYPNYETMTLLTAAAIATQRIRVMSEVLLAPLRNAAILAKQAATLDALSNGRLTLGLGIGGRDDDYAAVGGSLQGRGKRFEVQLETMQRIWSGQRLSEEVGPIGPPPARQGGPEVLIGGNTPVAIKRLSRWGDGFIAGGAPPAIARQNYDLAEQAWKEAGRPGKPRFVVVTYWGLGPQAAERSAEYIRHYYAFMGPATDQFASSIPSTPEAVKGAIQAFADVGVDELICMPCVPDLDQVDRLADLIG
jgi:alkanesulfonate monooxygenase SsuD/methylene tetrahydromethanopterin reductase-like flavin-dependent oxidoreductase (luciferase family)